MSHIHDGPLATYNALADPNLAGYFGNTRMRRQLRRSGLVSRRGEIVSENQYRVNMARKEHKKHVKDLLAQAIVHKTLDLERYRQVEIKRKLEEIAKIELVRRVRATRGRKGDEEVLPYLSPRSRSRPQSGRVSETSSGKRPKSAPSRPKHRVHPSNGYVDPYHDVYPESNNYRRMVIYVDDDGRPVSPPPSDRQPQMKTEEIDSRHLYALDSEALQKYALKLSKMERGRDGATSPYVISQFPSPPRRPRSERSSPRRSGRMSQSPTYKEKRPGSVRDGQIVTSDKDPDTVEGGLMLHRQEPAMMHQGEVQTLCEITMKYHGPNLTLPRDQRDPTQEVSIDQQHCGGNTLPVFKERLRAGTSFSFVSRRHRGYPFSLTLYIDGRVDCRVSTCCEYKHAVGVKLGGKMGHFSLTGITGATPCYKCKLSVQAPPRSLKLKKSGKKKRPEQLREEVIVDGTPRTAVDKERDNEKKEVSGHDDDDYEDDFDEDDDGKEKQSEMEKQYEDDFEEDEPPPTPKSDRREIIGLKADEVRENGRTVSVDVKEQEEKERREEEDAVLPPHRRIESYSSEDEDEDGGRKQQVKVDVHTHKKAAELPRKRRSSSSSSSSASSREASPREVKATAVKKVEQKEEEPAHVSVSSARSADSSLPKTDRSTTSSNSLTTETESMLEQRSERKTELVVAKPKPLERQRSVSSSSSSSSSSDSEDERLERKRKERQRKEEEEKKKKEEADRELERKRKADEDEQRRKKEDEERKKKFELERQLSQERMKAFEVERKKREAEMEAKKAEQDRIKEEERQKRLIEEQRMKEKHEADLKKLQEQRESEQRAEEQEEAKTTDVNNVEVEKQYDRFADMRFKRVRTEIKPVSQENEQQDASFLEVKSEITPQKKVGKSSSSSDSSSSSSDSESENERKAITKKAPSPEPQTRKVSPPPSPPKVDKKSQPVESSSSSTTTTSGSSSGSESEREKEKPPVTTMTSIKEETVEKKPEPAVKPAVRKSSSSSSSSSSDSESDSEAEKKKTPQAQPPQPQPARVPSPEVKTATQEVATPVKKSPQRRSSSSSTSSSSSSDSESEPKRPQEKKASPPPFGGLQHEPPLENKDVKEVKAEPEKQPVKKALSSSEDSSSDSSSSGSDSETESEPRKAKQTPKSATSESEGETMHGGADPEHVADGAPKGSTLAQSKVTPAEPQEGSIMGLVQGKSDIDLNGVLLNEDQIAQLSSYIVEADQLSMLSLRNSGLTDHSFGRLALSIQLSEAKPTILNLGLNELGPESMQPLTAALTKTPTIQVLILNGNPVGDEGYRKLVSSMVSNKDPFPFLRRSSGYMTPTETRDFNVDNSSRPIDSDSSKLTPGACKLTEMGLAETSVTDAGIGEISRLLETNTTLTSLNLNGNKKITKEGWARLSQALSRNTTLKNLSIDFCQVGDDGIAILSKGLRVNTALRSLELECTGITEKGGLLLRDLLKENTSILQVTVMPGNSISDGMMAEIRKYLALNNAGYSST